MRAAREHSTFCEAIQPNPHTARLQFPAKRVAGFALGFAPILVLVLASVPLARAQSAKEKAWEILHAGLADKNAQRRALAVRVLGLLPGDSRATELAENASHDEKPEVRAAAATALGQMGSKASAPKLSPLLQDKEVSVVVAAARALLDLGDPLGYEVYYTILTGERKGAEGLLEEQKKMLRDPKKMTQFGFEEGIGFIPLAGLGYSAIKAMARDDTSPVRAAAAKTLAKDPDARCGKALVAAASDKSWVVRAAALDAIARRRDPALLAEIEPKLSDEKDVVRYTAAAAVISLATVAER